MPTTVTAKAIYTDFFRKLNADGINNQYAAYTSKPSFFSGIVGNNGHFSNKGGIVATLVEDSVDITVTAGNSLLRIGQVIAGAGIPVNTTIIGIGQLGVITLSKAIIISGIDIDLNITGLKPTPSNLLFSDVPHTVRTPDDFVMFKSLEDSVRINDFSVQFNMILEPGEGTGIISSVYFYSDGFGTRSRTLVSYYFFGPIDKQVDDTVTLRTVHDF